MKLDLKNCSKDNLRSLKSLKSQKRALRTIIFSKSDEHHKPLFKELEILNYYTYYYIIIT